MNIEIFIWIMLILHLLSFLKNLPIQRLLAICLKEIWFLSNDSSVILIVVLSNSLFLFSINFIRMILLAQFFHESPKYIICIWNRKENHVGQRSVGEENKFGIRLALWRWFRVRLEANYQFPCDLWAERKTRTFSYNRKQQNVSVYRNILFFAEIAIRLVTTAKQIYDTLL